MIGCYTKVYFPEAKRHEIVIYTVIKTRIVNIIIIKQAIHFKLTKSIYSLNLCGENSFSNEISYNQQSAAYYLNYFPKMFILCAVN